ncbi:MAG: PTS sugar transporter subunit IIA [Candidatus Fermentithermobacillus carboniphilus]|uniref:PTS sugar transporter subunit IIA n=1 Tax=Candidatus Fermentithermobacillus carboniphilus TaxID=3085328 RepID=A0AAT9LCR5_9FIRM|nr:MAG: PTS sugar transporter subunit IIA [Candidatus Fermentithermobacillus carboniphilus]
MSDVAFDETLVVMDKSFQTKEEVIETLAARLIEKGYVKPAFAGAVLERESKFPTGLPTKPVCVAIPHADPEYCIKPCLAVARLTKPVKFGLMTNPSVQVDVSMVFLLGLHKGSDHVTFLCALTEMFQEEKYLKDLMEADDARKLASMIEKGVSMREGKT